MDTAAPAVTVGQAVTISGTVWLDRSGYALSAPLAGVVAYVDPYGIGVRLNAPGEAGEAFAAHLAEWAEETGPGVVVVPTEAYDDDPDPLTIRAL